MISAVFRIKKQNGQYTGFEVSGHAMFAQSGSDILCAGVSSAVMLTVNLLEGAVVQSDDSSATVAVSSMADSPENQRIVAALRQHLSEYGNKYPRNIRVVEQEA